MRTLSLISTIFVSLSVFANDECPIDGVYISAASKTLADYSIENSVSSPEQRDALTRLFGGSKHEWRCDEFRAWLDGYLAMDWTKTTILEIRADTKLVSFPETNDSDFHLVFEGPCYKIRVADRNYFEHYCPLDMP